MYVFLKTQPSLLIGAGGHFHYSCGNLELVCCADITVGDIASAVIMGEIIKIRT